MDQNYERAAEYYEAATRQGVAEAQFNLGALYAHGQGVEQSFETAREWWMKAAEQGHEKAIENLRRLLTKLKEEQHPPSYHPNDAPLATPPRHSPTN